MFGTATRIFAALALVAGLAACQDGTLSVPRHLRAVSPETLALMRERGMQPSAPIVIRLFKAEGQLEVWKQDRTGRYALLRSFEVCRFSGDLGPKVREGDRQSPEGFYTITPALMHPNSAYYLAFNTGFPNAFDRANGRTGSALMVHGDCSSRGCFAMTNEQIEEIFALARDAFNGGQRGIQLQLLPFRMTAENMFRFRRNPNYAFWQNLKEGSDIFETTARPPEVAVCARRYIFDRTPADGRRFEPTLACPPSEMATEIRERLARRQADDVRRLAALEREAQPSAQNMMARLAQGHANRSGNAPVHQLYTTRQQILASLPRSSPEALTLLPGGEAGPTDELRRIARGEMIGGPPITAASATAAVREGSPPVTVVGTASPVPEATAVASASRPGAVPLPLPRPGVEGEAVTLASAEAEPAGVQGLLTSLLPIGRPAPAAGTAAQRAAGVPAAATPAAPAQQAGALQRALGVFGLGSPPAAGTPAP